MLDERDILSGSDATKSITEANQKSLLPGLHQGELVAIVVPESNPDYIRFVWRIEERLHYVDKLATRMKEVVSTLTGETVQINEAESFREKCYVAYGHLGKDAKKWIGKPCAINMQPGRNGGIFIREVLPLTALQPEEVEAVDPGDFL